MSKKAYGRTQGFDPRNLDEPIPDGEEIHVPRALNGGAVYSMPHHLAPSKSSVRAIPRWKDR